MGGSWGVAMAMLAAGATAQSVLNPIVVAGNMLFDSATQQRFYIKGVRRTWRQLRADLVRSARVVPHPDVRAGHVRL
jgi:hypothetical protein